MNTFLRTVVMGGVFLLLMSADIQFTPKLQVGWMATAEAILGVRRRTRRRTAVVVGTSAYAAGEANASQQQAAAAPQQAAAAPQQQAAPAPAPAGSPPPVNTGAALPMGTVVQSLPSGCSSAPSGGVDYYKCGPNYYRAVFQGNSLVYVTAQP